jgi:hypothetical protein
MRANPRGEVLVRDLRLLVQAKHQLGALNLHVRCLTQGDDLTCFFKLFSCKGWLVVGMASTRHRVFLLKGE